MSVESQTSSDSNKHLLAGRIVSFVPIAMLTFSTVMKFLKPPEVADSFNDFFGWNDDLAFGLGIIEGVCTLLYAIPRTAVLGAILLTGYLGGAVATHVRIYDHFFGPIIFGVLVWLGLYLRDPRLRALLPLRSDPTEDPATRRPMSLFKKAAAVFATVVVCFVILAALQRDSFSVERKGEIAALPSDVFEHVNNFHKWEAWSPWAKLDPNAKNTFDGPESGQGAIFKWSGNDDVGEGQMTLTENKPGERIDIQLDFIRPFPDTSNVVFSFESKDDKTIVTWTMSGRKNFISKVFCLFMNMDKMVGGDFEKGLASLKGVVEGTNKK